MAKKKITMLGADIPAGRARLSIGTNEQPGPVIFVDDSLTTIKATLDEYFKLGKHRIAVIEAQGFRLIVDGTWIPHDGGIKLLPPQR